MWLQVGGIDEVIQKAEKLAKDVAARKDQQDKGKVSGCWPWLATAHCPWRGKKAGEGVLQHVLLFLCVRMCTGNDGWFLCH